MHPSSQPVPTSSPAFFRLLHTKTGDTLSDASGRKAVHNHFPTAALSASGKGSKLDDFLSACLHKLPCFCLHAYYIPYPAANASPCRRFIAGRGGQRSQIVAENDLVFQKCGLLRAFYFQISWSKNTNPVPPFATSHHTYDHLTHLNRGMHHAWIIIDIPEELKPTFSASATSAAGLALYSGKKWLKPLQPLYK